MMISKAYMLETGLWRKHRQVERLIPTDRQASVFTTNQLFIQLTNMMFWKNSQKKCRYHLPQS